jgi:beta-lactamase regulating signal transducer with metallopeptidase domain
VWILIKKNLLWIWLTGAIISVSWFITAYIYFTYRIRRYCTQPNREDLV